jgi:hypothetical protein
MKHDHFKASGHAAYDCFRLCFVARCGYGANLIDEATSWSVAWRHAAWAQQQYPNWEAFGQGYLQGHLAYRKEEGDTDEELAQRRAETNERLQQCLKGWWAQVPYDTPLS